MNANIVLESLVYKEETSDSSAIDFSLFGTTAIGECVKAEVVDFFLPETRHEEKKLTFRVIDGQMFLIVPESPQ